jgi:hypothetical protein
LCPAAAFATWLPERFLVATTVAATVEGMNQYLILIEQLVREGKSEREIESIVQSLVDEDAQALDDQLDELDLAA